MAASPRFAAALPLLAVLAACASAPPSPSGSGSCAWSYAGSTGPAHWARICPQFAACGSGSRQSPIDVAGTLSRTLPPLTFHYGSRHAEVVDQGHTVDVEIAPGGSTALEVDGRTYQLVQIHFHLPSEHKIDGRAAPMEMHMVHADEGGELAVVGVMMQEGQLNPVIAKIWDALDEGTHEIELDPADLLPGDRNYFGYAGSLTTPPCTEGVRWHVLRGSITLSKEQIGEFRTRYRMNARPLQNRNGRVILARESMP
jgi:carbonic anhydrase